MMRFSFFDRKQKQLSGCKNGRLFPLKTIENKLYNFLTHKLTGTAGNSLTLQASLF
jgi:hypothetical protein